MSSDQLSRLEVGEHDLALSTIEMLADALGVTVAELLDDSS